MNSVEDNLNIRAAIFYLHDFKKLKENPKGNYFNE